MIKLGLVVAVEEDALTRRYGDGYKLNDLYDTEVYQIKGHQVYAAKSGVGEINAAAAVQYLIDRYDVSAIVNYGTVGACSDDMVPGETCVVDRVVHYGFDLSEVDDVEPGQYPGTEDVYLYSDRKWLSEANREGLRAVTAASADQFVGTMHEKGRLLREYGADICDMESAGIIITASRNNVPCLLVKCVADGMDGGAEKYYLEKESSSDRCLAALEKILAGNK